MLDTFRRFLRKVDHAIEWAEGLEDDETIEQECRHRHQHAKGFRFTFQTGTTSISGVNMEFTMLNTQQAVVKLTLRLADGTPSPAALSDMLATTANAAIFTVKPDPAAPNNQAILTGVAAGSANLNAAGTATEQDGSVHTVTDLALITIKQAQAGNPAAGFIFEFGTPTLAPPNPPPPPTPAR